MDWDFEDYPFESPLKIDGDSNALPVRNKWEELKEINFGWKTVAILAPANKRDEKTKFRIGFRNGTICKVCTVVRHGETGVLLGPNCTEFFAFTEDVREIPLKLVRITNKRDSYVFII